jgi:predicted dehydrogenase
VVGGEPIEVEDAAVVSLEFSNGMVGMLNSGFYISSAEYQTGRQLGIMFWGRDGWMSFNPQGTRASEPLRWMSHRGSHTTAPLKTWAFDDADAIGDPYRVLIQRFLRACRGDEPPPALPEDAMWVNECIHAAYVASDTGQRQPVSIPVD